MRSYAARALCARILFVAKAIEAVPTMAPATPHPMATAKPELEVLPVGIWVKKKRTRCVNACLLERELLLQGASVFSRICDFATLHSVFGFQISHQLLNQADANVDEPFLSYPRLSAS